MITDIIRISGFDAYFADPNTGLVDLSLGTIPVIARTPQMQTNRQEEITGLQLLIESDDLSPLFKFSDKPLLSITVKKEIFSNLFADPFRHRVHNIAGSLDFNEGILENARVIEIDGIPTICSVNSKECSWTSKEYFFPDPITIDSAAWELATSKLSPARSFTHKIEIICKNRNGTLIASINTGNNFLDAQDPRFLEQTVSDVSFMRVIFTAKIYQDSFVHERMSPGFDERIGRPLLRAVNILELLPASVYDIHSLNELKSLCSFFDISQTPGPDITRVIATMALNAVLVQSDNDDITNDRYEFVEIMLLNDSFSVFEAKRIATNLVKTR